MLRVLGNSSERVPLPDLKDVVYYQQVKEYTDSEYESSRDLKKELARGRLIIVSQVQAVRGEVVEGRADNIGAEIRAAVKEAFSSVPSTDTRAVVQELAPIVADIVRQEMARITVISGPVKQESVKSEFQGPEYVPTVSAEGMVGNIEAEKKAVSGSETENALNMLKKLQGNGNK